MKKHSVLLKEEECEGCTNCVKNCPTKAIRVHQGKAKIKEELCIDCAECIRTCEYHAKYTETDTLAQMQEYKYPIALIPPSFYGQFNQDIKPEEAISSLYECGFERVYDVALAAEAVSQKTGNFLAENEGQYISSSCPVVVRLVKLLFPELIEYLLPIKTPVELMAQKVRNTLVDEKNISSEEIGVFFITPCPGKLTTVKKPLGQNKSFLDGAIAVDIIYDEILDIIENKNYSEGRKTNDNNIPYLGISWGQSGGEAEILKKWKERKTISVSGIKNVKELLEELTRNNLKGIKYFELVACPQGCVGGVLNVNNPFQAKYNINNLVHKYRTDDRQYKLVQQDLSSYDHTLPTNFKADDVGKLADDFEKAIKKLTELEKEIEILPGLDCAACGAPDCETLAEDIVTGKAKRTDCVFMLRKRVGDLADEMSNLAHELPPVMADKEANNDS
jgi:iron only hydrogenase large subunit-like protein